MMEKKVVCYCGKNKYLTECGDEANNFECEEVCTFKTKILCLNYFDIDLWEKISLWETFLLKKMP